MVYSDMTQLEICKEIGVSKNTISSWLKKDCFQEELKKETQRSLNGLAQKATRRLNKLLDSKNDMVALGACKEVLNKGGFKEVDKVEQNTTITFDVEVDE